VNMHRKNIISVLIVSVGMIGGWVLLFLWITRGWEYIAVFSIYVSAIAAILHRISKCPKCGENVFYYLLDIFGLKYHMNHFFAPDHCPHCGYALRETNA